MLKEASAKEPHYIGLLSDHHIIAPLPSHLRTEGESGFLVTHTKTCTETCIIQYYLFIIF